MQTKGVLILLSILTAIAVCAVLQITGDVFMPLVIAWFLLQIVNPLLLLGERFKLPHALSAGLVLCLIGLVFVYAIRLGAAQLTGFDRFITLYGTKLNELVRQSLDLFQMPDDAFSPTTLLRRHVGSISSSILSFSSKVATTGIFFIFMLLEVPVWKKKVDSAFSSQHATTIKDIAATASRRISQYLRATVLVSLITAVCFWLVLLVFKVEFALVWSILAFLFNFIPVVGPMAAIVPPMLMALLQFGPHDPQVLVLAALLASIQFVTGNILAPKLYGNSLGLSPVVIMLSLFLWGAMWGIPGAILAVPIASTLKIICEHIPSLRSIALMMGGGEK